MSTCGDGFLNTTEEQCDDNNTIPGDGCSLNCTIEFGYMCTIEYNMTAMPSISLCVPICGDGIVILPEECDDNNTVIDDGCRDDCMIEEGFSCENATTGSSFSVCVPVCGDRRLILPEECDDNNTMNGDGCGSNCTIEEGFACDTIVGPVFNFSVCSPVCGDRRLVFPEECDDNNTINGDGCGNDCRIEPGFTCDTMVDIMTPFSLSVCGPVCGDGRVVISEECDDNNTMNGDGCGSDCMIEEGFACDTMVGPVLNFSVCVPVCGDRRLVFPEECDDNNTINSDGCGNDCRIELGFACNITMDVMTGFSFSVCGPVCGDGIMNSPELCDDNNTMSGDGCSDSCQTEDQFECMPDGNGGSVCAAVTLLDLNTFDNTTLNYTNEFFDLNTIVYLSDPNLTNMTFFYLSSSGGVC